jgi:hypothetical protein
MKTQADALREVLARVTLKEADKYTEVLPQALFGAHAKVHTTELTTALITLVQDLEKRMEEVEECKPVQSIKITRGSYVMIWGSRWHVDWVDGAYLGVSNYKNEHHEQVNINTVTLVEPTSKITDLLNRV